ncbi:MerR family transcriptional regulator [Streptomyces sp. NPDC005438]|uniref:MerR family transcriptional regulator n=1 Tax=Streptomyces sp. NPDC005438 TaxID=3156880 RepID=UPI0033A53BBB
MEELSIGAFAAKSGLTPKALRLYDRLELLPPARVDPFNGYRYYRTEQLERARLVAWLRRLGMPLNLIREVSPLPLSEVARRVRDYWVIVEAETAARADLATLLVEHLTSGEHSMSHERHLTLTGAALTDPGRERTQQQDTAYCGPRLLAVADGFGPEGRGASLAAVNALRELEPQDALTEELLPRIREALDQAARAVRELPRNGASPSGDDGGPAPAEEVGTTLTALWGTGTRLAVAHLGDSRAYLLRGEELLRLTQDHTLVQAMVEDGRLEPEEVAAHPQRALLTRALTGGEVNPDLWLQEVRSGDRLMVCSDGLHSVVPRERLHRALSADATPEDTVRALVDLANERGGPDNISCVVADVSLEG